MEKGEIQIGKLNRMWRIVLLVFGLILGMLLIWFIVRLSFTAKQSNQGMTETNLLSEVDMTGTVKMIDESKMVIGGDFVSDQEIVLNDNTKYEIRNPRTFLYEEAGKNSITKDKLVYVELVGGASEYTAEVIKTDYQSVLGGRVKSLDGNRLVLVDYLEQEILVNLNDSTQIFILGKPDLLSVSDIPMNNNVIIYANSVYESGKVIIAEWVEVLEESQYLTNS
jgi:hypothetical protein